jgi:hypothetical protein
MKVFVKFLLVSVVVAVVAGCASDIIYIPKVPAQVQAKLMDYDKQPGNKAFVLAVDPSGIYSFGYEYGQDSLKEAVRIATEKCEAGRGAHRVASKGYIYALNDDVVYEKMIRTDNMEDQGDTAPAAE